MSVVIQCILSLTGLRTNAGKGSIGYSRFSDDTREGIVIQFQPFYVGI